MFFKFIQRNSGKARQKNGVYFVSLIISIVVFYIILSLENQDIILFLKTLESEAVKSLMMMIKILYGVSLFFMFFLVYFANGYQLQLRSREFGLYLMMGMGRNKLFSMILLETLWNGAIALILGLPISFLCTELISLATSRLFGMGIVGHQFRISWSGLVWTGIGFILVQFVAVLILSFRLGRKELATLFRDQKEQQQKIISPSRRIFYLGLGIALLSVAYITGVVYLKKLGFVPFLIILVTGISGTFSLFRGVGALLGNRLRTRASQYKGLSIFTTRQLQENVLHQSSSLAISSLLVLIAMLCFAYGISTTFYRSEDTSRIADFTFYGLDPKDTEGRGASDAEVTSLLESDKVKPYIKAYYAMEINSFLPYMEEKDWDASLAVFSWDGLIDAVAQTPDSDQKTMLLDSLRFVDHNTIIPLTSYNHLLQSLDREPIILGENQMAVYSNGEFSYSYSHDLLRQALQTQPKVSLEGEGFELISTLYTDSLVADRAITLSFALIVPDQVYNQWAEKRISDRYWNMVLQPDFLAEKGVLQATIEAERMLRSSGLYYESYLASMGRQMFYRVAGSYLTFYLSTLFLIIANTVLGLKFLMQQSITRHRYITLYKLGAGIGTLCQSAFRQIFCYFGLAMLIALISSVFGVWSLLGSFFILPDQGNYLSYIIAAACAIGVFVLLEVGYIWLIRQKSNEEIQKIRKLDREQ